MAIGRITTENGVVFKDLILSNPDCTELHRGFSEASSIMFTMPVILGGLFSRILPSVITIEEIRLHKITNITNEYHLIGMSESENVARDWGCENFITIDPALFQHFIVDVHQSYKRHCLNFPGRMEREKEHVALTLLYCSIKSITIGEKKINNPFYLPSDNKSVALLSEKIYLEHLTFLRKKIDDLLSEEEEKMAAIQFTNNYLGLYKNCETNPFVMTVEEFAKKYPDYMKLFLAANTENNNISSLFSLSLFKQHETIGEIAMRESSMILKNHPYIKNAAKENKINDKTIVTCYDDPYSYSVFD